MQSNEKRGIDTSKTDTLGDAPIGKLLLKFAIPAIISMLVGALYNIVDRIFIGHGVGDLGIAATTVAFPIMMLVMALAFLIGIGGNAMLAIKLGERKNHEAELIIGNCFTSLIVISILITAVGLIFLEPILRLFGASDDVLPYAASYMRIIFAGSLFQVVSLGMNNFIRTQGSPLVAMASMIIGAVLNCALDPIFIFIFEMGMAGAAYATIIAQLVSACFIIWFLTKGPSGIKIRSWAMKPHLKLIAAMAALGISSFVVQFSNSIVLTVSNNSLRYYGDMAAVGGDGALAAMGITMNVVSLCIMPTIGMLQAAQPIMGYNFGAKKYGRVRRTLFTSILSSFIILIIIITLFWIFPSNIIALFGLDESSPIVEFAVWSLRVQTLFTSIIGIQIIGGGYFQATGQAKKASFLSLTRQIIFLVPLLIILPLFLGVYGIVYAIPCSDLLAVIIAFIFLMSEMKRLKALEKAGSESVNVREGAAEEVSFDPPL